VAPAAAPATTSTDKAANPYRDPALEKDVWSGRPAWRASYGAWFLWAILSLAAIYAAHRAEASTTVDKVLWVLIGVAALWLLLRQASIILGVHYRLTTQRLFIQRGMLSRVTDQMELVRVDDVRVRQGIVDRLVNTGDIEVIGSDKSDEDTQLHNISAPNEVAEELRKNVRAVRARGTLFVENV
jgi:uncharacterized membrane protein YdbT with pleckstrin-like domain